MSETVVAEEAPVKSVADSFNFTLPLSGPSNMLQLADMMKQKGIENDDSLDFTQEFVQQFYSDSASEPGQQCMFNGEPNVWGRKYWSLLFLTAYYYPANPSDDVKRAAYQLVHSLRYLLPCEHCRRGYRKEILETPVEEYLESRETFLEWAIEVKTSVNKRLGKPPFDVDAYFVQLLASETHSGVDTPHNVETDSAPKTVAKPSVQKAQSVSKTTQKPQTVAAGGDTKVYNRRNVSKKTSLPQETLSYSGQSNNLAEKVATTNNNNASIPRVEKTNYGNRHVTSVQSMQSVKDAMRRNRNNLSLQQKANLQKQQLAQKARGIKEPAECKTCGKSKPLTPSSF